MAWEMNGWRGRGQHMHIAEESPMVGMPFVCVSVAWEERQWCGRSVHVHENVHDVDGASAMERPYSDGWSVERNGWSIERNGWSVRSVRNEIDDKNSFAPD